MNNRKGQLSLADAPTVVLLVGLVFLVMATVAYIGGKYGSSIGSEQAGTVTNESVVKTTAGAYVAEYDLCNFDNFAVTKVTNASSTIINSGNYSTTSAGKIANTTSTYPGTWNVSYTYTWGGTACDVTADLQTEIGNNTSIAGIVLTISLVGIVLTVLIGVFLVTRKSTT